MVCRYHGNNYYSCCFQIIDLKYILRETVTYSAWVSYHKLFWRIFWTAWKWEHKNSNFWLLQDFPIHLLIFNCYLFWVQKFLIKKQNAAMGKIKYDKNKCIIKRQHVLPKVKVLLQTLIYSKRLNVSFFFADKLININSLT